MPCDNPSRVPNKPEISPPKKGELYGKYTEGVSMGDLAEDYDRSKSTFQGIIEHRENPGTCGFTRREGNSVF
jgi:hypothetical protein